MIPPPFILNDGKTIGPSAYHRPNLRCAQVSHFLSVTSIEPKVLFLLEVSEKGNRRLEDGECDWLAGIIPAGMRRENPSDLRPGRINAKQISGLHSPKVGPMVLPRSDGPGRSGLEALRNLFRGWASRRLQILASFFCEAIPRYYRNPLAQEITFGLRFCALPEIGMFALSSFDTDGECMRLTPPPVLLTLSEVARRLDIPAGRAISLVKRGVWTPDFETERQWLFSPSRISDLALVALERRAAELAPLFSQKPLSVQTPNEDGKAPEPAGKI